MSDNVYVLDLFHEGNWRATQVVAGLQSSYTRANKLANTEFIEKANTRDANKALNRIRVYEGDLKVMIRKFEVLQ